MAVIGTFRESSFDILIQDVHPNRVRQAYDVLAPYASRWRQFRIIAGRSSFQGPREWHITTFLKRGGNGDSTPVLSAPELTVLELRKRFQIGAHILDRERDCPSLSCPKLRTLIVSDLAFDWSRLGLHMSLSNITSLQIQQVFLYKELLLQFMTVMGQMRALQHARIRMTTPNDLIETSGCSMIHPDLQTLRLSICAPCSALRGWFRNIHAPRLSAVSIHHYASRTPGSDHWHEEQEQIGWATIKEAVHLPSLTQFHCSLGPKDRCLKCLARVMDVIPTIKRIKFEDDTGMLHRLAILLTVEGPRPQVEYVEIKTREDTLEHREIPSKALALLNPEATMTIVNL
ncbi:hypothetical protein FRC03_004892 [Tulasnella sp. 419]|nr:hypothetical protein FRC03_004892 [Tulasnella sp. 419]